MKYPPTPTKAIPDAIPKTNTLLAVSGAGIIALGSSSGLLGVSGLEGSVGTYIGFFNCSTVTDLPSPYRMFALFDTSFTAELFTLALYAKTTVVLAGILTLNTNVV